LFQLHRLPAVERPLGSKETTFFTAAQNGQHGGCLLVRRTASFRSENVVFFLYICGDKHVNGQD
jgi:hypothetical protein